MFEFYSRTHVDIGQTHNAINRTHAEVVSGNAEVLRKMVEMQKLLLNGLRRTNSALSLRSIASSAPSIKTKEAMKQLCKQL